MPKLTLYARLRQMTTLEELVIVSPCIQMLMTGTKDIRITQSGTVFVTYTDGKKESRRADADLKMTPVEELDALRLVSYVQALRR